MTTAPTTECRCPTCGFYMTVSKGDATLAPGDWSICINCAEFVIYCWDDRFRVGTVQEQASLSPKIRLAVARARVMFMAFDKATKYSPSTQAVAAGLERDL